MEAPQTTLPSPLTRWLALAGVAAPLVFTAAWLVGGLTHPGYDPRVDHISALSAINAPAPAVMIGGFVVAGLLLLVFAAGLGRRARWVGRLAPGALLIGLAGLAMLVTGLVREDDPAARARGVPSTVTDRVHDGASLVLLLALLAAPPIVAAQVRPDGGRPRLMASAVLASAVTLGLGLLYLADLIPWSGLVQRLLISAPLGWLILPALRLARRA
jgi:hypothetical protein